MFPGGDYHPGDDRDHPPPYGDGRFGPGDTITREQMAAILYRYARSQGRDVSARADLSAYADAEKISPYAVGLCRRPHQRDPAALKPGGGATRAQAAAILVRFCTGAA
ncbi:MAG: S-layer homology domain-containing protein, partial [Flavonifractor plautii]